MVLSFHAGNREVHRDDQQSSQQIETLNEQLDEFKHYKDLFGDPNAVVFTTVQSLAVGPMHEGTRLTMVTTNGI
ncbi:MAG: hypothetical protein L0Z50_05435 [Verrucomicrobiales bacterium]|nr:hypothetical protein [Verrucomicrobiales bacterium]